MTGIEFEDFLGELLKKRDYKVNLTQGSNDQGADLIIERFEERTAIQAKRYKGNVGNSAIQEIVAAKSHYNCDYAIAITNSNFTRSARELAVSNNVQLWDRNILKNKIKHTPVYVKDLNNYKN